MTHLPDQCQNPDPQALQRNWGRSARLFSDEAVESDLRRRTVRGGMTTIGAQAFRFLFVRIGSTMVLARLLSPEQFGIIGMVMAIVAFVSLFRDIGLSMAIIQQPKITRGQVSSMFWVTLLVSVLAAFVTAAMAPLLVWFYAREELFWVTIALAGAVLLGGPTMMHMALLRRQMEFGLIATIEIAAMVLGVGAAILTAWLGWEYWALVLQIVVASVATLAAAWLATGFVPSPGLDLGGIKSMLKFGGNLTGFNLVNFFARNLDNVLIGWRSGAADLGLYSKAYQLLLLPVTEINLPIAAVALPALCRLQHEPERFRSFYQKALLLATSIGMPVVAFMIAATEQVILFIMGEQWLEVIPIFQALGIASFLGTFNFATGWVNTATGRTDRQLHWGIFWAIATVTGILVGLPFGAVGVALGLSISALIARPFGLWYCFRGSPISIQDFFAAIWRPAIASGIAGAVTWGLAHRVDQWPLVVQLALLGSVFGLLYAMAWLGFPGGRRAFIEIRLALLSRGNLPQRKSS